METWNDEKLAEEIKHFSKETRAYLHTRPDKNTKNKYPALYANDLEGWRNDCIFLIKNGITEGEAEYNSAITEEKWKEKEENMVTIEEQIEKASKTKAGRKGMQNFFENLR